MKVSIMKKKISLISLIILPLVSCGGGTKTITKTQLSYGSHYDTTATRLTASEVLAKTKNEESFLLALYKGEEKDITCSCWKTFSYIIDGYVKEHDEIVYKANILDLDDLAQKDKDNKLGLTVQSATDPSFAIFKNGKLVKQYFYSTKNTPTYFTNDDAFASFVSDNTIAPKMIYVDDEEYVALQRRNEETVISVVRKGCPDCGYMLPNVYDPFFKEEKTTKTMYLLDIEDLDHYHRATDDEKKAYQDYKDQILLSTANNKDYGYITGVVPTTFVFKNGEVIDGTVFFNDDVAKNDDGKYYISESYYSEERVSKLKYTNEILEGKILNEDELADYEGYKYLPSTSAAVYHTPIAKAFLNYYFK